jgi:hypothetical protein
MRGLHFKTVIKGLWLFPALLICGAFGQATSLASSDTTGSLPPTPTVVSSQSSASKPLPDLPNMPKGKSTVVGGEIKQLDRVRDQIVMRVFGGHDMRIAFDVRTEIFRDGKQCSIRDLQVGDHISAETMLDGNIVFARSIHNLSAAPDGQVQGQIVEFDEHHNQLLVRDALS